MPVQDADVTGYGQASFDRIAQRAGLSSKRLISYHFAGKDELIAAVIADVYAAIGEFLAGRVRGQPDAAGTLRAYIRALVEFIGTHRTQMRALMSVFGDHRGENDTHTCDAGSERRALGPVEEILRAGQRAGEFREFDAFVMASTVQRAIDGLPFLLRTAPDLDLDAYAEELVTLFDLATRRVG